jgi:manganese/iron transport system ATP-binding protein
MSSAPTSIEVSHLSVTYPNGHLALDDASFHLQGGCIAALVGINGSGKSTLLKALMGLVSPSRGSIRIGGMDIRLARSRNQVAYVPQTEEVDWSFPVSVRDVVMMGRYGHMNLLRIAKREDHRIVDECLEKVGLSDLQGRQIGELSGGQKKRAFLARALAQQAPIILLDEPFTGVDVTSEEAIIVLLRQLRDQGQLLLVSTHNLGSVPEFCDQVVLIRRSILAAGPLEEVFTESNLKCAFGGVLRQFHFESSTIEDHDGKTVKLLTDDERPLVFGRGGHLEYRDRQGREQLVQKREKEAGS